MTLEQRFLKYISFDTQSDPNSSTSPSTQKQFLLGKAIVNELHDIGVKNAYIDEFCYVYAYLPSNVNSNKTIGLIAHLDTATELTGANVQPQIIENYQGDEIIISKELNIKLSPDEFPRLKSQIGHRLITTDGTTLLGADDKAGIAIIMDVVKKFQENPNLNHPNIIITFTPDEEIGLGTAHFNYQYYQDNNCDFAYTLDGAEPHIINFENFNAASADVLIKGLAIHPGSAKGKMINSLHLAMEFHNMLPSNMIPSLTENYEGFNHLNNIEGGVHETKMHYIIRNHDVNLFRKQIDLFEKVSNYMNFKYGPNTVNLTIRDTYYNMRDLVLEKPDCLTYLVKALRHHQINAEFQPIRGGTDGAHLSYGGIITPNIGTGGANFHGPYEYIDVNEMELLSNVLVTLCDLISK